MPPIPNQNSSPEGRVATLDAQISSQDIALSKTQRISRIVKKQIIVILLIEFAAVVAKKFSMIVGMMMNFRHIRFLYVCSYVFSTLRIGITTMIFSIYHSLERMRYKDICASMGYLL